MPCASASKPAPGFQTIVLRVHNRPGKEVADAVKFANESPEPGMDLLESTTYSGPFAY